jgi:hypothetical protein
MKMSEKQWVKQDVVKRYCDGLLNAQEAAGILGRSTRQLRRLARKRRDGVPFVVHGNTGRAPRNKRPVELKDSSPS